MSPVRATADLPLVAYVQSGVTGLPDLAAEPILERLDEAPAAAPKSSETEVRREVIAAEGQWVVLNTRVALNEASARRLDRSYQRAKPARLVESASGKFAARPFVRDDTWLVAVCYQPSDDPWAKRPGGFLSSHGPPARGQRHALMSATRFLRGPVKNTAAT